MSESVAEGPSVALSKTDTARRPGSPASRVLHLLANSRELTLLLLILLLGGAMAIFYPNNFPTQYNMSAVLLNMAQNSILVTGMMLLMIGGAFDLSIGSTLALAGVVSAVASVWWAGRLSPLSAPALRPVRLPAQSTG